MRLLYKCLLAAYIVALGFRVFTPRTEFVKKDKTFTFGNSGTLHDAFYYEGSGQWLGNFMMLIPLALLVTLIVPKMKSQNVFLICLLTSVTIESIQLFIPGRVSDWRDILVNTLGVVVTLVAAKFMNKKSQ